ncbi:uncharacterized protein LOC100467513 [Ailuropoda melanoleuca]|nr:uncharacterized protein LOC100467513 [Ailuropoda melanoleuca]
MRLCTSKPFPCHLHGLQQPRAPRFTFQLFSEKISGVEGTKLDDEFLDMERKIDITNKAVAEILSKATEYLQPNPAYRAKLGMLNTVSKIRGQVKTTGYPQTEGLLGDCMLKYGKELGEGSTFGNALIEVGESMKLMAEVKDSLDINVKQTFIDPLQLLQDKDLKEIGKLFPVSPIRGQVKTTGYPQTEGLLGDCMLKYGKELGEGSTFGNALIEVGESMKLMAEVKDSLDINVKQTFIDPLQLLQDKDLKEIGAVTNVALPVPCPSAVDLSSGAECRVSDVLPAPPVGLTPVLGLLVLAEMVILVLERLVVMTLMTVTFADEDTHKMLCKFQKAAFVLFLGQQQSDPEEPCPDLFRVGPASVRVIGALPPGPASAGAQVHACSSGVWWQTAGRRVFLQTRVGDAGTIVTFPESAGGFARLSGVASGRNASPSGQVEQVSQLAVFIEAALDYHRQSTDILQELQSKLQMRCQHGKVSETQRDFLVRMRVTAGHRWDAVGVSSACRTRVSTDGPELRKTQGFPAKPGLVAGPPHPRILHRPWDNFPLSLQVEQVSQLAVFIEAALDYHRQSTDILQELQSKLQMRISAASSVPRREYKPRPIKRSPSELNGVSSTSSAKTTGSNVPMDQPCCRGLYDFEPENQGELGFKEGDIITLTNQIDENWYEGMLHGASGFFPINYVEVIVPLPQ